MSPQPRRKQPAAPAAPTTERRQAARPAGGLEDVTRSLRVLTRSSRDLVIDGGEVLERELAMAISLSERLRDESLSPEVLKRARSGRLNRQFRDDAHRVVDLVADVGGVAAVQAVRFVEQFADQPRPRLASEEKAVASTAADAEALGA